MGDEAAPAEEEPKVLTISIKIKGARSVGLEPPPEPEDGAEPPADGEEEVEKPWMSLVQFEWPNGGEEDAPQTVESEVQTGNGEVTYALEREFTMPHSQESLDFLAVTTVTVKLLSCKTEVGKSGDVERVEGEPFK
jgi:hypothetical protein